MDEKNKKESGLRYNQDKVRMDLLSPIALEATAAVLTAGSKKYADHNWRKGMNWSICIGSLMRHWNKFMAGEDYDFDSSCEGCQNKNCKNHSGLPHIDHVATNAMFLQEYMRIQKEYDDRFKVKLK